LDDDGQELELAHIIFDEFVGEEETTLEINLGCFEIDWSEKYGVFEPLDGDGNELGTTLFVIGTNAPGTTTQEFSTTNFNGTVQIQVIDYPFAILDDAVIGDVNGDGNVDVTDLLSVISAWGPCGGCLGDLDNNGTVDVTDLLIIIGNWS
ncbi:hypothetical protein H8D29_00940, partial [PVC group bacterium]|nr:hypothetical protein [PVC group bacterium]